MWKTGKLKVEKFAFRGIQWQAANYCGDSIKLLIALFHIFFLKKMLISTLYARKIYIMVHICMADFESPSPNTDQLTTF